MRTVKLGFPALLLFAVAVIVGVLLFSRAADSAQGQVVTQGPGAGVGNPPWIVTGIVSSGTISIDGGFLTVTVVDPCATDTTVISDGGSNAPGGYSIGGDAGAGTIIVAQNDGGPNRARLCNLTVNTPNPSGVEIVCGPSANGCATDGGVGSTQTILGNYYFSGPGINANGSPFAYVCPKAGDSMCVFTDGGAGWDALPGFKP